MVTRLRRHPAHDLSDLQRGRESRQKSDRSRAGYGGLLAQNPPPSGDPLRQAGHYLRLYHGLHAVSRISAGRALILGGQAAFGFTQIIYQRLTNTGSNWPRGSAYAIVLMLTCVLLVLAVMKIFKVKIGEIGR